MSKNMKWTIGFIVWAFVVGFFAGHRNAMDKGWRITEDGDMVIYKHGVTIIGGKFFVDANSMTAIVRDLDKINRYLLDEYDPNKGELK